MEPRRFWKRRVVAAAFSGASDVVAAAPPRRVADGFARGRAPGCIGTDTNGPMWSYESHSSVCAASRRRRCAAVSSWDLRVLSIVDGIEHPDVPRRRARRDGPQRRGSSALRSSTSGRPAAAGEKGGAVPRGATLGELPVAAVADPAGLAPPRLRRDLRAAVFRVRRVDRDHRHGRQEPAVSRVDVLVHAETRVVVLVRAVAASTRNL